MVPLASFMCMAQTSFFAQNFAQDSAGYTLMVLCTLLAFPAGFLLLARSEYPEATFWIACALVVVFPYDSLIALMAMTSLLARRSNRNTTIRATVGGTIVTLISQLRDALQQPKASIWHLIFAQPHTGGDSGSPMVMLVEEPTVIITATVASLVFVTIATLIGLHIRSRARLRTANAVASAATTHAATPQTDLTNQQLGDSPEAQSLADKAEDIRRQSAGALDEAHSIIDMLRNPHQAWEQLAPSDDTSLTRESLDALIADTRNSGTSLNTWIDIQQLSVMDESIGKVAYRAIQEGLTNARRHAPGAPVSLEVSATPQAGVHIHISNPIATDATETQRAHGAGLPGLAARVHSVNGQCRYGMDDRHLFHVDVQLPWRS
ncbi:sensor histidine kinase [Bifidobacterium longum]|uniref:sensor histidine kinase n=1 Tax=Bifidobacterium longum TaxID=216816 RepID=UPI0015F34041|nr:sensor histidine kinase [Bifidobacterium longum]